MVNIDEALTGGESAARAGERDLKKGVGVLREEPKVRFASIAAHQRVYPVALISVLFQVSRSGFYYYLARVRRGPSQREQVDAALLEQIKALFEENSKRSGSPRIHAELRRRHVVCSLQRVKRLMREANLYAVPERKYKRRKTTKALLETVNLLVPKPDIIAANQVWYSDSP